MNDGRNMRTGAVVAYVNTILNIGLGLALTPFLIRTLGGAQYGLYQMIGPFVGHLAVLDFGLGNSIIRYVSKYRAEGDEAGEQKLLGMCLRIYLLITVFLILISGICYPYLGDIFNQTLDAAELGTLRRMFTLLAANWAVNMLQNTFASVIQAYRRFTFHRAVILVRLAARATLLLILLSEEGGAVTVVWIDTALNLCQYLIYIAYAVIVLHVRVKFGPIDRALFREVFTFSFYVFLNAVMEQIYWKVGATLLAVVPYRGIKNTMMVAIHSAGTQLALCFMQFSVAISGVLLPRATEMVVLGRSRHELTDFMIRVGRIQLAVLGLLMVGFFSIGRQFVIMWLGPEYGEAFAVAAILFAALLIPLIQNCGISILQAMNRHAFRSVMQLTVAMVSIPASIMFIHAFGVTGAALGTGLSLIAGNVIGINLYYGRVIGLNIVRFFGEVAHGILPGMIVSYVVALAVARLNVGGWTGICMKGVFTAIVYIAIVWRFGLSAGEKGMLRRMLIRTH